MTLTIAWRRAALPLVGASALLAGCAAPQPPSLYEWNGYQREVYDYLKGEKAPQEQIDALEKALQKIRADGKRPPPGFQAQLGVLYAGAGNDEQAMQAFEAEKESFPESAPYMDLLMKKPGRTTPLALPPAGGDDTATAAPAAPASAAPAAAATTAAPTAATTQP
ncbi:DUF4810 domain-containing protein [Burkholderia plantarii]|uniref:DUF4810 domain-containing protein n=1 Tax=Burkholderia plantarii TaxID=41899 RepID=UPI0018DE71B3|nr:DUF4810 domain-containing protein [Burkholderia plantarii]MBI0329590.1 DUF4810 domain-containing protein [Burkholderia plantarii]